MGAHVAQVSCIVPVARCAQQSTAPFGVARTTLALAHAPAIEKGYLLWIAAVENVSRKSRPTPTTKGKPHHEQC
jgi:hypothetical protein